MEPNLRDTPLRRFSTFTWGISLFVVFAIALFVLRSFVYGDQSDVDTERGKQRLIKYQENRLAQDADLKSNPKDLFSKAGEILNLSPSDSGQAHKKEIK